MKIRDSEKYKMRKAKDAQPVPEQQLPSQPWGW